MRYLSPIFLFDGSIPDPLDKKAILLGRKKLLAELELNAGENIDIHGISLSKNDIIDYFDALQQEHIAGYYQLVAGDEVLETFLQDHQLGEDAYFKQSPLYQDPSFIRWISPYFRSAFTSFTDDCFRNTDAAHLETLLNNPLLMTVSDEEGAWSGISKLLDNNISRLEYYHHQSPKKGGRITVTLDDVSPLMSVEYLHLIQLLPERRFNTLRDKYAFGVMEAGIFAFNRSTSDRTQAITWIENAEPLAVSPDIKNALAEKLVEMHKLQKKRHRSFVFRGIWVAIILGRVLFSNSCNNDDMSDIRRGPVYIHDGTTTDTINSNTPADSVAKILMKHSHQQSPSGSPAIPTHRLPDSIHLAP